MFERIIFLVQFNFYHDNNKKEKKIEFRDWNKKKARTRKKIIKDYIKDKKKNKWENQTKLKIIERDTTH